MDIHDTSMTHNNAYLWRMTSIYNKRHGNDGEGKNDTWIKENQKTNIRTLCKIALHRSNKEKSQKSTYYIKVER